ncbi:fibronectin type III domain-containing protein [Chryseobacterium sp. MMS23-Vi53]|uniref:fibronectin type III domain-containing protein n=1 Tax=Chryseobacterium sp. MMS23-Vi53 TaxID=3386644 RepID=UPI0039ECC8F7
MKKILLFFFLALSYIVNAQVNAYSFAQSSGTYTPLPSTATVVATATGNTGAASLDNVVYPVTLPFGFSFNGSTYTSINVSTNGFITFGATAPGTATYNPISSTDGYAGAISAWGKDLNTVFNIASVTGNISWSVVGTAPNREIVIQWTDFRPAYATSATSAYTMSFQIRLRETTNTIAVVYKSGSYLAGTTSVSGTAQVGLRGATNADFNHRTNATTVLFTSSALATANGNSQAFNTTAATPGMPSNGLTYTWTPPTCFGPSGFVATGITSNTASVSWTSPTTPPANGYEIYYSTTTTAPATPQITGVASTATSYTIPGLSPNTTYYIWIKAKCSATDQSTLIGPITVYTGYCVPTGGSSSTTYYLNNITTTGGWTNLAYTASTFQGYVNSPGTILSSPGNSITTNLASAGNNTYFYYVWVDWNNDLDFNDPGETIIATTTYTATATATIAIPAGQALGNYRVRTAVSESGAITACGPANYGNYVDFTLSVIAPPTCLPPTGLVISNATTTSATIQWTVPSPAPAGGYDVYYNTTGVAPAAGTTPQFTGVAGPSQLISGLTPNTTYYIWVRAKCSGSDISYWSGPRTVYTNYCAPTGGSSSTTYYLNNITTTGGWTNLAYTASTFQGYVNSPGVVLSSPGNSITTNLASAGNNTYYYYVWVDWNNDLDFNDPGETILATTTYAATATATIAIPAGQALGNYRVRTAVSESGAITACGPANYGNYVDFTLSVIAPPTCLPPTGLVISNATTTSATIQWTVPSPAPAGGYDVYYNTTGVAPAAGTTPQFTGVAGPSQLISGLTPNTTYYIWVRAKCSGSDISYWSGPRTVYTNYCAPTGGSSSTTYYLKNITTTNGFTNLAYTATTYSAYVNNSATSFSALPGTTVNVSMNSGTSSYYYYLWIDWNNNMVFDTATETVLATTTYATNGTATINTAGRPSGSYRARFATSFSGAISPCGPAPYGNYVDFTFIIRPCSTTAPTNVNTTAITYNSATVNWTASPDNLNYKVYWRKQGTTTWTNSSAVIAAPTTNYVINTGLDPATAYEVMVVSICNTTEGTATPIVFTTKCDPTPPNVTISNITTTSALITWSPLAASSHYFMRYRIVGSGNAGWSANIALPVSPTNTYTLSGLDVYTTYEVQIANMCDTDTTLNPWSNPKVFTTERTCQIPPPGLTITNISTTTAEVTWDPFPGATYILRYRKVGIPSWTNVPVSTNTYTITGLLELTQYEMQVVNVCNGTPGTYTQPYLFTTPTVVYCQMASTTASTVYISKVTAEPNGKPKMENQSPASNYTDYTSVTNKFIELIQGSSNNKITIEKKPAGSIKAGVAVWIDFNRNGYFDIDERILVASPSTDENVSATFSVPADAFISLTDYKYVVMRVAMSKDAIPVNCTNFPDGEVEDYTVRITKAAVPNAINQNDILIYPNPVSTVLNVKNISAKANYKIYNAAGQMVSSGIILNNKINVHNLINGVYMIDIQDGDTISAQKKFIKE